MEVAVGLGHSGQQEVVLEEMVRRVTQVWGWYEGETLG